MFGKKKMTGMAICGIIFILLRFGYHEYKIYQKHKEFEEMEKVRPAIEEINKENQKRNEDIYKKILDGQKFKKEDFDEYVDLGDGVTGLGKKGENYYLYDGNRQKPTKIKDVDKVFVGRVNAPEKGKVYGVIFAHHINGKWAAVATDGTDCQVFEETDINENSQFELKGESLYVIK